MWGIACIFVSSCLFIHLGLGEAIGKALRIRFILFRCVKCLVFWSVCSYSLLIVQLPVEVALCVAFALSYASLWVELLLGKIATVYEKINEDMDAEESEADSGTRGNQEAQGGEKQESPLPEL